LRGHGVTVGCSVRRLTLDDRSEIAGEFDPAIGREGYTVTPVVKGLRGTEIAVERKLRRPQLTDDGNVEISGRDLRESNPRLVCKQIGQHSRSNKTSMLTFHERA